MSNVKVIHDTDIGANLEIVNGKLTTDDALASDAEVAAAIAADNVTELSDARARLMPRIMLFDRVERHKGNLPIEADADPTKSKWIIVPNNPDLLTYPSIGKLIVVNFDQVTAYHGGYPDYVTDTSKTMVQFCVAPMTSNSDEINANLAATNQIPPNNGIWSYHVDRGIAASLPMGGSHHYSKLWMRYVNVPARAGDVAQNVVNFGGSCPFVINSVHIYDSISSGL